MEKLLQAAGSSLAEFEALRVGRAAPAHVGSSEILNESSQAWRSAAHSPLPVMKSVAAGAWGDPESGVEMIQISRDAIIEQLPRPASLVADRQAYAMTILGNSMWPRFRPGARVAVSPLAPVRDGDDVIVMLRGPAEQADFALVYELVRQTELAILLRQHHPSIEFEVPADKAAAVHRVLGELI